MQGSDVTGGDDENNAGSGLELGGEEQTREDGGDVAEWMYMSVDENRLS